MTAAAVAVLWVILRVRLHTGVSQGWQPLLTSPCVIGIGLPSAPLMALALSFELQNPLFTLHPTHPHSESCETAAEAAHHTPLTM